MTSDAALVLSENENQRLRDLLRDNNVLARQCADLRDQLADQEREHADYVEQTEWWDTDRTMQAARIMELELMLKGKQ